MIICGRTCGSRPSSRPAATWLNEVTGQAAKPIDCAAKSMVAAVVPTST